MGTGSMSKLMPQIVAISLARNAGYSAFRARMSAGTSVAAVRCFSALGGRKQACHTFVGKPSGLTIERTLGDACLFRAFSRRVAEEHDGAQDFIAQLFGKSMQQRELLPIVGWRNALPLAHLDGPLRARCAACFLVAS